MAFQVSAYRRVNTVCQVCDDLEKCLDERGLLVDKDAHLMHLLNESRFLWRFSIVEFGARVKKLGYSV